MAIYLDKMTYFPCSRGDAVCHPECARNTISGVWCISTRSMASFHLLFIFFQFFFLMARLTHK